ncbi:MAG TPA: DUF6596 domain-containing protein [Steroidobacteraceae bacterium]
MPDLPVAEIERIFRAEHGRAVAVLIRAYGDIDMAEEAVQDAFLEAVQRWPSSGLPPSPAGWIITAARNRAIDRLRSVLAVVYLIFNEGYTASSGDRVVREDLCAEGIRLGRLLRELMPREPEVSGLLALMLLIDSRRAADGQLVLLADQDRALWDRDLIAEGHALTRLCIAGNRPGPYQMQAAINAVHSGATSVGATDWAQILRLYDQLVALAPSPVAALNRAVAVAEVRGPQEALARSDNTAEKSFLQRRRQALDDS